MTVHARFYVAAIERYASSGNRRAGWADPAPIGNVTLRPVTRGEANSEWASATPGGEIKMTVRGSALPWFEERLGVELAITFDDVPEDAPAS